MKKAGKPRGPSRYTRDIEAFIPRYIEATDDQAWTMEKVADWAIENKLWDQPKVSPKKQLMRELSRIARNVTFVDENGVKVRKYHAFRLGPQQPMLWAEMEHIQRDQMNESKTMRRDKLAAGSIKLDVDVNHFNSHYNPGNPLDFDPNFANDIAEARHSREYKDTPPDEVD